MDLQSTLKRISNLLITENCFTSLKYYKKYGQFTIIHNSALKNSHIASTGSNSSLITAYIKSLLEFGEEIIRVQLKLNSRCGIAGGMILSNIKQRAKLELIERDSFLYHYRKKIPFKFLKTITYQGKEIFVYQMESIIENYASIIVFEKQKEFIGQEIVHFGTAASLNLDSAIDKAIEEYFSMELFFSKNEDFVTKLLENKVKYDEPLHYNIKAIFDERNINLFKRLRGPIDDYPGREKLKVKWNVDVLNSPIHLFKYVKVSSNDLYVFCLGEPENTEDLYHPFW